MSELLGHFLKFNKIMGLNLTNTVSTQLKIGLCITDFSGGVKDYQSCQSVLPKFSFFSQLSYQNRGVLISIDPKIVVLGTQRCFGGIVDVANYKGSSFTFSEIFFGKQMMSILNKIFEEKECNLTTNKIDYQLDRSHLFFSDEKVLFVEMKCSVEGNNVGSICMVYPLIFVKQEKEKWIKELS
ncbi:hypothetical protein DID74_00980 [Candidatus Marinamargulisbacteria bacterium SCGC AG-333-B06]|nr:hypothetical protein DID74_00980 [Candidatus Marinamargulisbacteria bacterium SCGC AG-333-B06]